MKLKLSNISSSFGIPALEGMSGFDLVIGDDGCVQDYGKVLDNHVDDVADCTGLTLCPGWIDMHTHVFKDICDIALEPDLIGPRRGVTVLVDAGSSGCATFPTFRDVFLCKRDYPIFAFLNYGSLGIIRCNVIGDYETDDFIQEEETLACIEKNREWIKGVKVRACSVVLKSRRDVELVEAAKKLACKAGLPLMVHIGEPKPELKDILEVLRPGDIVTHCFHGKNRGRILDSKNDRLLGYVLEAKSRGILFDVGHGCASFDFQVGKKAIEQGFLPDLYGTDLHNLCYPYPAVSLAVTMSKLMACGVPKAKVLEGVTLTAAKVLEIEDFQGPLPGKKARFTLFSISGDPREYCDSMGNSLGVDRRFVPHFAILGTKAYPCME